VTGHLLVVDDEPNIREVLRIVLEAEGYDVREAATYGEAMQLLGKTTFDLVICDIVLPDGNGLDLVRSYHAGHPDTKFVVITAHNTPAQALTALRDGAVEYLSKPFDVDELKLVVEKRMQLRSATSPAPEMFTFIGRSRAAGLGTNPASRTQRCHRPHHGRIRDRQRAAGARDPRGVAARGEAVRARQLRSVAGGSFRE
jgi:DNA-binding NtrC family response regulator